MKLQIEFWTESDGMWMKDEHPDPDVHCMAATQLDFISVSPVREYSKKWAIRDLHHHHHYHQEPRREGGMEDERGKRNSSGENDVARSFSHHISLPYLPNPNEVNLVHRRSEGRLWDFPS
jgi:hypothetical protein